MKLTKEEIKFIDDYLIKNGVKYWEVRLELLDHMVLAVEDTMKVEDISFNEALLEAHRGFGNQLIEGSIPKKDLFIKGLYQSNNGFKRLLKEKQIQGQKKFSKQTRILALELLKNPVIYFEFLIIGLLTWMLYVQSLKTAIFVLFGVLVTPFLIVAFLTLKEKMIRKSLLVNHMAMVNIGLFAPLNIVLNTNSFLNIIENKDILFLLFLLFFMVAYPIVRAQLLLFLKMRSSYKEHFKTIEAL